MKWLYIKNGNAVEQLRRVGAAPKSPPKGGTEAYIGDFLHHVAGQPVLLLSCREKDESLVLDSVSSRNFNISGGSPVVRIARMMRASLVSAVIMFRFKPDRIICGKLGFLFWTAGVVSFFLGRPMIYSSHNDMRPARGSVLKKIKMALDVFFIRKAVGAICHGLNILERFGFHRLYDDHSIPRWECLNLTMGQKTSSRVG